MIFFSFFVSSVFLSFFLFCSGLWKENHTAGLEPVVVMSFVVVAVVVAFCLNWNFPRKSCELDCFNSRKFLSTKNVFKSGRQVVRQEYIFVKRQSPLRKKDRVGLRSHSFVYLRNEGCKLAAWRLCLWLVVYLHIRESFWSHTSGFVKKIQSGI